VLSPDAELAARVRDRQAHWSVNGLATSLVPDLLQRARLDRWSATTRELKHALVTELGARGFDVTTADAPWVLIHRAGLRSDLAQHAVLVRDCTSFGWPDTFRMATPRADDLPRLLSAVDRVLDETGERHD
jgi:histidinol-phosphate/aromatic aminotransferase/cobyric acid decarboxylase-like protein